MMKLHKLAGLLLLVVCAACSEDTVTTDPIDLSQVGAADDFTDTRDGHVYKCVRIGDQIWMAENLAYFLPMGAEDGCYTYGQDIYDGASVGLPGNIWGEVARKLLAEWTDRLDESARSTIDMYIGYIEIGLPESIAVNGIRNASAEFYAELEVKLAQERPRQAMLAAEEENGGYSERYGFLYSLDGARAAVPEGWRLPTDEDWLKLEAVLGMAEGEREKMNAWRGTSAGDYLKAGGESGFEALFAGCDAYASSANTMDYINESRCGYFWCDEERMVEGLNGSTAALVSEGVIRMVAIYSSGIWRGTTRLDNVFRPVLYSVRCVKDAR